MKSGLKDIVGKTVKNVVVAKKDRGNPRNQVFLVFDDNTYFEFWGELFSCAGGVDAGSIQDAISYAERCSAEIVDIYPLEQ